MGGLAQAVARHARALAQAGHVVHACVPTVSVLPDHARISVQEGITVHQLRPHKQWRDTLTAWSEQVITLDREINFDIFHGHFLAYAGFVAAYLARYCGKKSVVSAMGNDVDRFVFDAARAPFVFKALEWADAVTAVSHDLVLKIYAVSGRQDITVVPNGVDSALFNPDATDESLRERLGLDENIVLGFVGEASAQAGLPMLLRAFARVSTQVPVHLLLVGGIRVQDQPVMDLFSSTYPHFSIRQVPYQPHHALPAYYNLMDLMLIPALREGLPNVLLEGMACGRPVIAPSAGGISDVIAHGEDGWLFPPQDEQALIESIMALIHAPQTRKRIGAAARDKIRAQYTLSVELECNLAVYRELFA
jgi:glycosyltransferase involved in cell wall biosynthesis